DRACGGNKAVVFKLPRLEVRNVRYGGWTRTVRPLLSVVAGSDVRAAVVAGSDVRAAVVAASVFHDIDLAIVGPCRLWRG
ncbi:MAG: hypothetical protein ABUS48_04020, partial [Pseudomonadota bacterium]